MYCEDKLYSGGPAYCSAPMPNDQTAKQDDGKLDLSLVPPGAITAIAKVRDFGNLKYHDPDNWKSVESIRFWRATLRHILRAWNDPSKIDLESGLPHIYHAMCNLSFIADRMEENKE